MNNEEQNEEPVTEAVWVAVEVAPEDEWHDLIQQKWEEYIAQPVNFGEDTPAQRIAEYDAFVAGALAILKTKIPF